MKLVNTILPVLLSLVFTIIFLVCLIKFTNGDLNLVFAFVLILIGVGIYIAVKHKKSIGIGLIFGSLFFVIYVIQALREMD